MYIHHTLYTVKWQVHKPRSVESTNVANYLWLAPVAARNLNSDTNLPLTRHPVTSYIYCILCAIVRLMTLTLLRLQNTIYRRV